MANRIERTRLESAQWAAKAVHHRTGRFLHERPEHMWRVISGGSRYVGHDDPGIAEQAADLYFTWEGYLSRHPSMYRSLRKMARKSYGRLAESLHWFDNAYHLCEDPERGIEAGLSALLLADDLSEVACSLDTFRYASRRPLPEVGVTPEGVHRLIHPYLPDLAEAVPEAFAASRKTYACMPFWYERERCLSTRRLSSRKISPEDRKHLLECPECRRQADIARGAGQRTGFPAESCPPLTVLKRTYHLNAPGIEIRMVRKHVEGCPRCAKTMSLYEKWVSRSTEELNL